MKIEQDFDELIKFNEKINKLKKDIVDLETELGENCTNFVENHGIKTSINKMGSIENLLDRGVSPKQLTDLIQRINEGERGILSKLPRIKNHIEGKKLDNEILNYNEVIVEKLELKYKSLDSIENIENLNNLDISPNDFKYLIDINTEKLLKSANDPKFKRTNDDNHFVYMVVFNTLKIGDELVVIYNYIAYNKIFFNLLYAYAALEQKISGLCPDMAGHIAADFFFVIDKQLSGEKISKIDNIINKNNTLLTLGDLNEALSKTFMFNFIQVVKYCCNGKNKNMNYDEMGELIKFLKLKNEVTIFKFLCKDIPVEK